MPCKIKKLSWEETDLKFDNIRVPIQTSVIAILGKH